MVIVIKSNIKQRVISRDQYHHRLFRQTTEELQRQQPVRNSHLSRQSTNHSQHFKFRALAAPEHIRRNSLPENEYSSVENEAEALEVQPEIPPDIYDPRAIEESPLEEEEEEEEQLFQEVDCSPFVEHDVDSVGDFADGRPYATEAIRSRGADIPVRSRFHFSTTDTISSDEGHFSLTPSPLESPPLHDYDVVHRHFAHISSPLLRECPPNPRQTTAPSSREASCASLSTCSSPSLTRSASDEDVFTLPQNPCEPTNRLFNAPHAEEYEQVKVDSCRLQTSACGEHSSSAPGRLEALPLQSKTGPFESLSSIFGIRRHAQAGGSATGESQSSRARFSSAKLIVIECRVTGTLMYTFDLDDIPRSSNSAAGSGLHVGDLVCVLPSKQRVKCVHHIQNPARK